MLHEVENFADNSCNFMQFAFISTRFRGFITVSIKASCDFQLYCHFKLIGKFGEMG
jgi:hypothetical protein